MIRTFAQWLLPVILVATLVVVPARSQTAAPPMLTAEEKQKQIDALAKQLAELQAKLEALKTAPTATGAAESKVPEGTIPDDLLKPFAWRPIGPCNMGGRVSAMAVNENDPTMYWVGFGGGGLLKTINNGTTFEDQFHTEATSSIGDVAVASSDANIVWVGTGENNPRNSVSYGDGVYKSIDGGKTWKNMGLKKTFQIGKIAIHPKNPDIVYVGALGRLYGANEDRGVFKTEDGGKTWSKVHFVDDKTGVVDLRMDPTDPNVVIAAYWDHRRDEHDGFFGTPPVPDAYGPVVTHGPGGGIYKTADGGKKWTKVTKGLPTTKLGRIGLDYSRKTKGLLVAVVDTDKSGTGPAPSNTYFGAVMDDEKGGGVKLSEITDNSPAMKAGLKNGEVLALADDKKLDTAEIFIEYLQSKKPNDKITVTVKRDGKDAKVEVTLGARNSEPTTPANPPSSGIRLARGETLTVGTVVEDGPAAKAGIKEGDVITKVGEKGVTTAPEFIAALATFKPMDKVKFTVVRGKDTLVIEVTLGMPVPGQGVGPGGPPRGVTNNRPFGMGLGGQQANVQRRQGKDGIETGGIFQSADNGDTWTRINSLNPRPMYFSQIRMDPSDDKTIYVLGDVPTPIFRSIDGGANFSNLTTAVGVHADGHALWIDPKDPRHILVGCDGGFYVSYDKGAKWDHINTSPMGQFYHVAVDNRRPYKAYGGLQDNGSWGGPSDTLKRTGPVNEDWIFVSGGDGFVCRVDPNDPDLVYAESQGGAISRRNYRTGESSGIRPGRKQGDEPLRFHWNTPFILSSHNSSIFYSAAQFVFKSVKKGDELKQISPDLSRTKAGTSTALAESPKNADVLWAGTDDGYIWLTKDGGNKWENLTANIQKAGLAGYRQTATIEPSREKEGRCYVTFDAHRSDDDKPYIFLTEDFGATWKNIAATLPQFGSTRVCREDIVNPNILYAGTEFAPFVTINRGDSWTKLGSGLPTVACHEFAQPTTANELVVATHGRSVLILDINALRQMKSSTMSDAVTLFAPAPAVRWKIGANGESPYSSSDRKFAGTNPARGTTIDFVLAKKAEKVELKVTDANGKVVYEYRAPTQNLPANYKPVTAAGLHRVNWSLSAAGGGGPGGPGGGGSGGGGRRPLGGGQVAPGLYKVTLTVDGKDFTQPLNVELDPNAAKDIVSTEDAVETQEAERKAGKPKQSRDDY